MSNIAIAIDGLIKESRPRITGADLARASGINTAQISRIRNGVQQWVNPEDLTKICLALCKDPKSPRYAQTHARLLYGRLLDECTGPGAALINIKLLTKGELPATTHPRALPPSLQQDMDDIANHIESDRTVRDLISSVAKLCRREPLSAPVSK